MTSLLEELDAKLGEAILHSYPTDKATKARELLFEIDRRVTLATIAIENIRSPTRGHDTDELASLAAHNLNPITPQTDYTV